MTKSTESPELEWTWSYPALLAVTAMAAGAMVLYFHREKRLQGSEEDKWSLPKISAPRQYPSRSREGSRPPGEAAHGHHSRGTGRSARR